MTVDILIIMFLIGTVLRGRDIGLVRQFFSAVGFLGGLYIGAVLQPHLVNLADTTLSRAVLSVGIVLGSALLFLSIGEYVGILLKHKVHRVLSLDKADVMLGGLAGGLSMLVGIWLLTPALTSLPSTDLQQTLGQSKIISYLSHSAPSAPQYLARIERLVNPNGFPDVFAGLEPRPSGQNVTLPSLGDLAPVVAKSSASVVKLEGRGCGGIVEGSGFVAANGYVITNAHVIAGVSKPTVLDNNGRHNATPIWFDPDLDMAVLKVDNLAGQPLTTERGTVANGTDGVVLGYPGGGDFTADPANVMDQFTATGRNIYGNGITRRAVYELKANIIPGNSGGPVLDKDGDVVGLVFAQSTTYQQVGYALTIQPVMQDFQKAVTRNQIVATSSCAE